MATVEYYDENVFRAATSVMKLGKISGFKPQELSNTVSTRLIFHHNKIKS